jgi:hypothetical protein
MAPKHHRGSRSAKAGTLCALAVAVLGAILLAAGLTQRNSPQAAPLPAATTEPRAASAASSGPTAAPGRSMAKVPAGAAPQVRGHSNADSTPKARTTMQPKPPRADNSRSSSVESRPNTLSIPVLAQLDIPITTATETDTHILEPPADVHTVGIWTPGATLAATSGTTDIIGHVNYTGQGPGALHDIAGLRPGDRLYTTDNHHRTTTWTVTTVQARNKNDGVDASAFPGPAGTRQLILITCGGPFDPTAESYLDNIYVRAQPTITPQS